MNPYFIYNTYILSMKNYFLWTICSLILCGTSLHVNGQIDGKAFLEYQLTFPRVSAAYNKHSGPLKSELHRFGFKQQVNDIYIRSFKAENEMEVWVRDAGVDTYRLFKLYKVCALSGDLGPKRREGDLQVPEGLYFITHFNPTSDYHLSMLVSYPNYADRIKGNKQTPGGDIYIHGGCVTIGCLPMQDEVIREIYTLCLMARSYGQTNIPVHIFPARFTKESIGWLTKKFGLDEEKQKFWVNLKSGFDYFERTHKLIPVMYNQQGKYVF